MISSLYLNSSSPERPLRIGVMVDGFELCSAFRSVLMDIQSCDFARLELVVVNCEGSAAVPPAGNKLSRYLRVLKDPELRRSILYGLYSKFDQRHAKAPNPLESVDCADILGNCPRLDVIPIKKRFVHRFPPDAIDALRSYNLDVVLRFGFNILRGDVLTSARCGVWSFHHGDNDFYRGGPALLWELMENNPLSGVMLQVLTEKLDDGYVLCKSRFATDRGLWRSRNAFFPYWGSTHFVIRKLKELHESGWETVKKHALAPTPYQGKKTIYRAPTNAQMVKWLAPTIARKALSRPFRREKVLHWRICLRRSASPRMLLESGARWTDSKWIPKTPGHFYADPVLVKHADQVWLFFEDYSYGQRRGRISCAAVQPDLSVSPVTPCLDLPYHLSYPLVFRHDGETFMIPETGSNNSVELYRATNFPFSWKLEKTLFKGAAVDTTPLYRDGIWYFFTTLTEHAGNDAFGALFYAKDLTAEWKLHPSSPISTDVRDARSAGAIEKVGGRFLRPVQDSSESYGRRIHVKEVLELTPDRYEERSLHSIEPDWEKGLRGVHTYGFCEDIEVMDTVSSENLSEIILDERPQRSRAPEDGWFHRAARRGMPGIG
jgi:hypothetical protein